MNEARVTSSTATRTIGTVGSESASASQLQKTTIRSANAAARVAHTAILVIRCAVPDTISEASSHLFDRVVLEQGVRTAPAPAGDIAGCRRLLTFISWMNCPPGVR